MERSKFVTINESYLSELEALLAEGLARIKAIKENHATSVEDFNAYMQDLIAIVTRK